MVVVPLTYTICDYKSFVALSDNIQVGTSRNITAQNDYGKVAKLLSKITQKEDYSLFHLSVGLQADQLLIHELYDLQLFKITALSEKCAIVDASFQVWKHACILHCTMKRSKDLRVFLNKVFLLLESSAADSVNELHKMPLLDGTFKFKNRFEG